MKKRKKEKRRIRRHEQNIEHHNTTPTQQQSQKTTKVATFRQMPEHLNKATLSKSSDCDITQANLPTYFTEVLLARKFHKTI